MYVLIRWVKTELEEHRLELWIDGTKQYISHAEKLLEEFKEAEKGSVNSGAALHFSIICPAEQLYLYLVLAELVN